MTSTGYLLALVGAESRRRWVLALSSAGLRPADYGVLMTLDVAGHYSRSDVFSLAVDRGARDPVTYR